jgi:hypothetical protein
LCSKLIEGSTDTERLDQYQLCEGSICQNFSKAEKMNADNKYRVKIAKTGGKNGRRN